VIVATLGIIVALGLLVLAWRSRGRSG